MIDPLSNNYMMVLQYANQGNLREYLKNNFNSLQKNDKIQMALDIACGLKCLHSKEIIHRDLVIIIFFILIIPFLFSF